MPVNRPHDKLFRAVFGHAPEAAGLLRAHLPETLARDLQWSSLTLQDATFVDDELRGSESDLLFSVERTGGDQPPVWLYVLLEHQSKPSRWMPFRLLKYCCRIWDRSRRTFPQERYLRPIIPVVFYQGRRRWRHAAQFAELFPRRCERGRGCRDSCTADRPVAGKAAGGARRVARPHRAAYDDGSVSATAGSVAARRSPADRRDAERRPRRDPPDRQVPVGDAGSRRGPPIR